MHLLDHFLSNQGQSRSFTGVETVFLPSGSRSAKVRMASSHTRHTRLSQTLDRPQERVVSYPRSVRV